MQKRKALIYKLIYKSRVLAWLSCIIKLSILFFHVQGQLLKVKQENTMVSRALAKELGWGSSNYLWGKSGPGQQLLDLESCMFKQHQCNHQLLTR